MQSDDFNPELKPGGVARRACVACRVAKAKCDRSRPCGRCSKKGLQCKDPVEGRPTYFRPARWRDAPSLHEGQARASKGGGTGKEEDHLSEEDVEWLKMLESGMEDLYALVVEVASSVFKELHTQGKIPLKAAMRELRLWLLTNDKMGLDQTRGLLDEFSSVIGADLGKSEREGVFDDNNDQGLLEPACKNKNLVLPFSNESIEGLSRLHPFLASWNDGMSPRCSYVADLEKGNVRISCDDQFSSRFIEATRIFEHMKNDRVPFWFVLGRLLAAEDRQDFVRGFIKVTFCTESNFQSETFFLKVKDSSNNASLGIVRLRRMVSSCCRYSSIVISIEQAPMSRHLSTRAYSLNTNKSPITETALESGGPDTNTQPPPTNEESKPAKKLKCESSSASIITINPTFRPTTARILEQVKRGFCSDSCRYENIQKWSYCEMATTLEPGVGLAQIKSGIAFIKSAEQEFTTLEVTTGETGQNSLEPLEFVPNDTQDEYGDLDFSELAYWWSEEDSQGVANAPPAPDAPIMNLPNVQPFFGGTYNNPIPCSGPF